MGQYTTLSVSEDCHSSYYLICSLLTHLWNWSQQSGVAVIFRARDLLKLLIGCSTGVWRRTRWDRNRFRDQIARKCGRVASKQIEFALTSAMRSTPWLREHFLWMWEQLPFRELKSQWGKAMRLPRCPTVRLGGLLNEPQRPQWGVRAGHTSAGQRGRGQKAGAAAWSLVLPRATREFISSFTHVVLVFGVGFFGNSISSAFLLSLREEGASPRGLGELWECDLVVSRGTGGKKQHHIYVLSCFYAGVIESSAHPYATQDLRWMRTVGHSTCAWQVLPRTGGRSEESGKQVCLEDGTMLH